jgi:hypothetical protein
MGLLLFLREASHLEQHGSTQGKAANLHAGIRCIGRRFHAPLLRGPGAHLDSAMDPTQEKVNMSIRVSQVRSAPNPLAQCSFVCQPGDGVEGWAGRKAIRQNPGGHAAHSVRGSRHHPPELSRFCEKGKAGSNLGGDARWRTHFFPVLNLAALILTHSHQRGGAGD